MSDSEFIRKGLVGGQSNEIDSETVGKFNDWNHEMKKKLNLTGDKNIPYWYAEEWESEKERARARGR